MGFAAIAVLALTTVAAAAKRKQEQEAAEIENEQIQEELTRQQEEAALREREGRSERAAQADKEAATLLASMVDIGGGGGGGLNVQALVGQIGFDEGLDLARISVSKEQSIASLQSEKNATAQRTKDRIKSADIGFVTSVASAAGDFGRTRNLEQAREAEKAAAEGRTSGT